MSKWHPFPRDCPLAQEQTILFCFPNAVCTELRKEPELWRSSNYKCAMDDRGLGRRSKACSNLVKRRNICKDLVWGKADPRAVGTLRSGEWNIGYLKRYGRPRLTPEASHTPFNGPHGLLTTALGRAEGH